MPITVLGDKTVGRIQITEPVTLRSSSFDLEDKIHNITSGFKSTKRSSSPQARL